MSVDNQNSRVVLHFFAIYRFRCKSSQQPKCQILYPLIQVESHGQQPSFGNGLNVPSDLLNTHGHRRCSYDYLEIFDGTNPDDGRSFGRYCGSATLQNTPATIRSTQNTLTLVFRTDFSGERRGFRLQYSAVLPFPGCNGKVKFINEMSGELTSPK